MMNDYTASQELIDHVKPTESLALTPYVDAAGYTTWGYGHKQRPGEQVPQRITEEQADALLAADLNIAGAAVRRLVTIEMTQAQFDGLTDWTFNLGQGALAGSTMLHCVNAGDWDAACDECKKWVHAGGRVLNGLVTRRAWDADHMRVPEPSGPEQTIVAVPVVWAPGEGPGTVTSGVDPNAIVDKVNEILDPPSAP